MVPLAVPVSVPMTRGLVKAPVAPESCALNTLPASTAPLTVNGTLNVDPAQNGEPTMPPVLTLTAGSTRTLTLAVAVQAPFVAITV